jgi:hypothetical protein
MLVDQPSCLSPSTALIVVSLHLPDKLVACTTKKAVRRLSPKISNLIFVKRYNTSNVKGFIVFFSNTLFGCGIIIRLQENKNGESPEAGQEDRNSSNGDAIIALFDKEARLDLLLCIVTVVAFLPRPPRPLVAFSRPNRWALYHHHTYRNRLAFVSQACLTNRRRRHLAVVVDKKMLRIV